MSWRPIRALTRKPSCSDLIERAWPSLEKQGLSAGASRDRLTFTSDLDEAVGDAEFVQESAPDWEDLKIEMFEKIGAAAQTMW